jgi:hypothetical protein
MSSAVIVVLRVCPRAPGDAQRYVDQLTGYVLWGVLILFGLGVIVAIGAIVAGRLFSMPHASKVGVISIVVVFVAALAYLIVPGVLEAILGSGCLGGGGQAPR